MFSFFIIFGIIVYSFVSLTDQISNQALLLETSEKQVIDNTLSFDILSAHYEGGRLKLNLVNDGNYKLFFKQGDESCIDVYINGVYLGNNKFDFYIYETAYEYYFLDIFEKGILDNKINLNLENDIEVKIVTCGNLQKTFIFDSNRYNWLNETYLLRSFFNVTNSGSENLRNLTYTLTLNSTNFDITKTKEDGLNFFLPVYENTVLDVNFDDYNQDLVDYSRYSNPVTLGLGSGVNTDDPTIVDGVFFNALEFDGINDFVRTSPAQSLELQKALTYSAWVKWSGESTTNQTIFRNGRDDNVLKIINETGSNDNKVYFGLSIDTVDEALYSSIQLDTNWHLITGTFNGTLMELYIDDQKVGSQTLSLNDVDFTSSANQIGSGNSANFFNGSIDDVKIFNIALTQEEVALLYKNKLKFRDLNYTVNSWDLFNANASVDVTIPFIANTETIDFELYYYNLHDNLNQS
jgi:hypothetical protein